MNQSPQSKKNSGVALILAWVVPGCGHLYLGKRGKAVIFFVIIVGTFIYGMWLSDFQNVNPARYDKHFFAQVFAGVPAVAAFVWERYDNSVVDEGQQTFGISFVYTCVAGLLNLLVIVDAAFMGGKGGKQ